MERPYDPVMLDLPQARFEGWVGPVQGAQEVELLAPKVHHREFNTAFQEIINIGSKKVKFVSLAALESIAGMLSNSVLHGALGCGTSVCVCVLLAKRVVLVL
jgi:hypothetical protein